LTITDGAISGAAPQARIATVYQKDSRTLALSRESG